MRAPALFRNSFSEKAGIDLTPEEKAHLIKVLRISEGKIITINTPDTQYICQVLKVDNHHLSLQITDQTRIEASLPIELHLIQGLPKQDKFSEIIRMCTELGVHTIYPVETKRSQIKLAENLSKKGTRWSLILDSANQQCQRQNPAQLAEGMSLDTFVKNLSEAHPNELRLIAWEDATVSLKESLLKHDPSQSATKVWVVIGPEGGLAKEEITLLQTKQFIPVSLGKTILRTEHAGFAVLAQLAFAYS